MKFERLKYEKSVLTCSDSDTTKIQQQIVDDIKRRRLNDELRTLKSKLPVLNKSSDENGKSFYWLY